MGCKVKFCVSKVENYNIGFNYLIVAFILTMLVPGGKEDIFFTKLPLEGYFWGEQFSFCLKSEKTLILALILLLWLQY